MILIYYAKIHSETKIKPFHRHMNSLPNDILTKIDRFRREEDKVTCLLGRLLIQKGLHYFNSGFTIEDIKYTEHKKPYLPDISFNITHTERLVVCVFSKTLRVGIDSEKRKPIDPGEFAHVFSENEWHLINGNIDPMHAFYHFWTRKECLLKAEGTGLLYPLQDLDVSTDRVFMGNCMWSLTKIDIEPEYETHIATSEHPSKHGIVIEPFDIDSLSYP